MIKKSLFVVMALTVFLNYCVTSAQAEQAIKIGGVGSALGAMKLLAAAFEKAEKDIKVQVLPSLGSTGGIKAVAQGAVDIGLSGRALKDEEKAQGVVLTYYAKSPFIFVTTPDIKKSNFTMKELEDLYGGKMETWPDGARIRLLMRTVGESDTIILKAISPRMNEAIDSALVRPGMMFVLTDQENIQTLAKIRGAFGVSTLTQTITEKPPVKILSYNGVKPGVKALADGSYPLYKPFYLATMPNNLSEPARKFIAFMHSPAGRKILAKSGNLLVKGK